MKALLIIDVQKGYIEKYAECLLSRINQRIQYAVQNEELIIYVKNVNRLRSGTKINELAEHLNVCSSYVVCKETASAFSNNELLDILRQNQVTEIEIVGIDGNSCVASTAIDAQRQGYKVILPCEYIGVKNIVRFEKKKLSFAAKGITAV